MKKYYCPIVILIVCSVNVGGTTRADCQNGLRDLRAALFENVNREMITTGILYDTVIPFSRIEDFSGGVASKHVRLQRWRQIYHEIRCAHIDEPRMPTVGTIRLLSEKYRSDGIIPIAVLHFNYNRIRPDAIRNGLLESRARRLIETGGEPYLGATVFAAAALRENTHRGRDVVFALDGDLYFTNEDSRPGSIRIDFADGRGYRNVSFEDECHVRYTTTGRKIIRIEFSLLDGRILHGSFAFQVEHLQTPDPHDTISVTAAIPYEGVYGSGEAYVYLSDLNSALTNPVIVIEGFDIDNDMNWDELYQHLNKEGLVETLRTDGYDLVVLNFLDSTDYIQRNGFVAVELIQQVVQTIHYQSTCALVGASMGGLIGRYALAYMENHGLDHRVRTFISFDGPHKGANIPLGIQYWMVFFADDSESAAYMLERLDTPAAKQMLVYHHTDPPGTAGEGDSLRSVLEAEFASIGDYPVRCRKAAVANGSGYGADQGFAAGDQLILYEYSSFLVDIVGNVWAVPDSTTHIIFDGLMDLIWPLPDDQMQVHVSDTRPYDSAPGGYRASMAQMDTTEVPYGDIIALHQSHCFVPTVSALDLDTDDLFHDIANDPGIMSKTPFDTIYFPVENQEHVDINEGNAGWFLTEIHRGVTGVDGDLVSLPDVPVLYQNYPNPFNPSTTLRIFIPHDGFVTLTVYNVLGEKVKSLINQQMSAGRYTIAWNGCGDDGRPAASGIYFCSLEAGVPVKACKLVLIR